MNGDFTTFHCVCYSQNDKLHGGTNEAHLGNRAEED